MKNLSGRIGLARLAAEFESLGCATLRYPLPRERRRSEEIEKK
jgi:hypothetical protein